MSDNAQPYLATEAIAALIDGVSNLPGVTLDARDGMGVTLHTTAQVKDWLTEELFIAQKHEKGSTDAACEWCGRAIDRDEQGRWYAVKGAERGYDPLVCDAVADRDDTDHAPTPRGS